MLATPTISVAKGPYNKLLIPRGRFQGDIFKKTPGFFTTVSDGNVTLNSIQKLPNNDDRGLINSKKYSPTHPRSTSLMCNEGSSDSEFIGFMCDLNLQADFEFDEECQSVKYPLITLFHSHVLWSYEPRISLTEAGEYSFSLDSVGPHLSVYSYETNRDDSDYEDIDDEIDPIARPLPKSAKRDCNPKNVTPGQGAPPIGEAFVRLINVLESVLEPSADGSLVLTEPFPSDEFSALTAADGILRMRLFISVPRSYFDLSSVIDLTTRPTVPASTEATVAKILSGEKPKGWDFKLTSGFRGSGDASVVYYMHSAALESKSPTAKATAAIRPSEKARGVRVSLNAEGLAAAVRIAYGVEVPLPKSFHRDMAITLEGTFGDHFTSVVVPQWEREICRRALVLDVRNPASSSMVELLRLLDAIWEMPYGYFPVAKRVAVGVLADMMHVGSHTSALDFVQNKVLPSFHESGMNPSNLLTVLASLAIHLNTIPGVKKVAAPQPEEIEQIPPTPSDPAHVELEMPPTELPYPEESIDIDPASIPATRSCSIL